MRTFVSFKNLLMRKYLFIYNSFLIAIEGFDFICKTKFCSLPNFTMCHLFNICYVSNVCETYYLLIPNFVKLGSHIFLKTKLVIIYFTKIFYVYEYLHFKTYHVCALPCMWGGSWSYPLFFFEFFFSHFFQTFSLSHFTWYQRKIFCWNKTF